MLSVGVASIDAPAWLFLVGLIIVALIALVPEVLDLIFGYRLRRADTADKGAIEGRDGQPWTKGLTRGSIALAALAIFAVSLFSLIERQCPAAPIPAPTTAGLTPTTSPSVAKIAPAATPASPSSGSAAGSCADNGQTISAMFGAIIALVAAISAFYFGARTAETTVAAIGGAAGAAAAASATPPPSPPKDRPDVELLDPLLAAGAVWFRGKVTPHGDTTYYRFEWGVTHEYGIESEVKEVPPSADALEILSGPHSLLESFHYRLVAWNDLGISATEDREWPT
jgi:hypothetical protein